MPSRRIERITEGTHRELTTMFRELRDPRVQGLVSIICVGVTNDLSYYMVYISAMKGLDKAKTAVESLESTGGHIRRELGLRLKLHHVPVLLFHATDSIGYSANISRLLSDWEDGEEENGEEHDD